MSTDYTLFLPAHFDVEEAVAFFDGEREGLGLRVSISENDSEEVRSLVGDQRETQVTFHFSDQQNFVYMLTSCIAFFAAHPWVPGYLAHNGEMLLLQRLPGGDLVLEESWRDYAMDADAPELDAVQCVTKRISQPWL